MKMFWILSWNKFNWFFHVETLFSIYFFWKDKLGLYLWWNFACMKLIGYNLIFCIFCSRWMKNNSWKNKKNNSYNMKRCEKITRRMTSLSIVYISGIHTKKKHSYTPHTILNEVRKQISWWKFPLSFFLVHFFIIDWEFNRIISHLYAANIRDIRDMNFH